MAKKGKPPGQIFGVPIPLLTTPRDGETLTDRWWVTNGDGYALFWQGPGNHRGYTPQCNRDMRVAESLQHKMYPDMTVEHIPVIFVGRWDWEWGYTLNDELLEGVIELEWSSPTSDPNTSQ